MGRHACPGGTSTHRSPLCTSQPEHSASAVGEARLGELSPSENIREKILNGRKSVRAGAHPGQMAASDPAREPTLERAMPADAVPGSTIPEDTEAEVLLQDGTWAWAQVTGQRKDRHGRWCVGLRWYASPAVGGREGWYLYNPAFIRRPS